MAANWLKINGKKFLNTNRIVSIEWLKSKNQYEIIFTDKEVMNAKTIEHATTFDITDEKED